MQLELYNALKAQIETLTELKKVGLWNNQFERENVNVPFGYPCCWIEFADIQYTDYLKGEQQVTMNVNLHLGFESYKTEDTAILTLKQQLHAKVHTLSVGNYWTKLLRRGEVQNFDHPNVQEYIITYAVSGKDYSVLTLPTTVATVDTLNTNNAPVIDNDEIRTGVLPDSVLLTTEDGYVLASELGYQLVIQQ